MPAIIKKIWRGIGMYGVFVLNIVGLIAGASVVKALFWWGYQYGATHFKHFVPNFTFQRSHDVLHVLDTR